MFWKFWAISGRTYVFKLVNFAKTKLQHECFSENFLLRKKHLYSKFFWSTFSRIQTEYGELLHISPYSVRMWKNKDQKNPEYRHFLRSVKGNYISRDLLVK